MRLCLVRMGELRRAPDNGAAKADGTERNHQPFKRSRLLEHVPCFTLAFVAAEYGVLGDGHVVQLVQATSTNGWPSLAPDFP